MKSFLHRQPPAQLRFIQVKENVYSARGVFSVVNAEPQKLAEFDIYRFDFFLKVLEGEIKEAAFFIDMLANLYRQTVHSELTWENERNTALQMIEYDEKEGGSDLGIFDRALNYWEPETNYIFDKIESLEDLRQKFIALMDGGFVLRHYFETEWVIPVPSKPISINFKKSFS